MCELNFEDLLWLPTLNNSPNILGFMIWANNMTHILEASLDQSSTD